MAKSKNKNLTIEAVKDLGTMLIDVANQFPTRYLTETDFYPLVLAYLSGRVPKTTTEHAVKSGDIDFRTGGTQQAGMQLVTRFQNEARRLEEKKLTLTARKRIEQREEAIKKGNKLGRASFWLSAAGVVLIGITTIPAIIYGHKSLKAVRGLDNAPRAYALTGLIIGYVFGLYWGIFWLGILITIITR